MVNKRSRKKTIKQRGGRRGQMDFKRMESLVDYLSSFFTFEETRPNVTYRDPCDEEFYGTEEERRKWQEDCDGYGHGAKKLKRKTKKKHKEKKKGSKRNKKSKTRNNKRTLKLKK